MLDSENATKEAHSTVAEHGKGERRQQRRKQRSKPERNNGTARQGGFKRKSSSILASFLASILR